METINNIDKHVQQTRYIDTLLDTSTNFNDRVQLLCDALEHDEITKDIYDTYATWLVDTEYDDHVKSTYPCAHSTTTIIVHDTRDFDERIQSLYNDFDCRLISEVEFDKQLRALYYAHSSLE